jgi:ankyrin repeat protein
VSGEFIPARYLLDHGADPNKIDGKGFVALHAAAKNGLSLSLSLSLSAYAH